MHKRRGFTLIELIVTMVVIALIAAIAGGVATRMYAKMQDRTARDTLRIVAAAQERFHEQRGRFTDSSVELKAVEAGYSYVTGAADSSDGAISVSTSGSDQVVGLALRSKSGSCFMMRVEDPNSGTEDATAEMQATDIVCAGSVALDQVGQEW